MAMDVASSAFELVSFGVFYGRKEVLKWLVLPVDDSTTFLAAIENIVDESQKPE